MNKNKIIMKKLLLLFTVMLTSAFAMAEKADYTSVTLTAEEIDLDNDETIGVLVNGTLDPNDEMYAPYGMVYSTMNNAYLYEGTDTEGVKLEAATASWGKALVFGSAENLKPGTSYKLVIKMGGISTTSMMSMSDVLENKEEITLQFTTKAERTDPFVKQVELSVGKYELVDIEKEGFEGITVSCIAKNLPTVGAYNMFMGAVRLYEQGKDGHTTCIVNGIAAKEGENTFTIVPKDKLEPGKAYTVELFLEGLYVHNMFDPTAEVCYFPAQTVEFYTKHEAPTAVVDYTIELGEKGYTVTSPDNKNFFTIPFFGAYLLDNESPAEYFDKKIGYANEMDLKQTSASVSFEDYFMAYYPGDWYLCVAGAEYDENQEGCYMTTKPVIVKVRVDEQGNVTKVTGIQKLETKAATKRIFSIDGVERLKLAKGINIVGGKKIFVK